MGYIAGIDIGGTNCRIGIFSLDGNLEKSWRFSSKPFQQPEYISSALSSELNRFEEFKDIVAVGIGVPGLVNSQGIIASSPNYPDWNNLPLRDILTKELKLPVFVDNDANVFAVGEHFCGVAKDVDNFVVFTIGTGIGGGLFLKGSIFHGAKGMAGEIGHIVLHPSGPQCGCGKKGCLEAYSSGTAIKKQFAQLTGLELEPKEIYELAKKGDKAALKTFEKAAYHLGIGIANIVNIIDVSLIVLGGGVSQAFDIMQNQIKKGFKEHTFEVHLNTVEIKLSSLQDNAGLYGGFAIAKQGIEGEKNAL